MFTAISYLPFFSQFNIDKNALIEELQKLNSKIEEKPKEIKEVKEPIMNVQDNTGKVVQTAVVVQRKKRGCAC